MPQIILAGAVLAGAWLAVRLARKALGGKSEKNGKMSGNRGEAIVTLRRDPETGVYVPAEGE